MKATVTFTKCIQDSQEYGSDNEYMVSRVFFILNIDGKSYPDLQADLKQVVGSNFESGDIEVSRPSGYKGAFNYTAFRDAAERYFRRLVGAGGTGIRITGGASNIRMQNNIFVQNYAESFDVDASSGGW